MPPLDQAPFLVLENMTLPLWGLHSTEALLLFAQMFPVFISMYFFLVYFWLMKNLDLTTFHGTFLALDPLIKSDLHVCVSVAM